MKDYLNNIVRIKTWDNKYIRGLLVGITAEYLRLRLVSGADMNIWRQSILRFGYGNDVSITPPLGNNWVY